MLNNFPIELRQLNQWIVADMTLNEAGEPKKFPLNPRTGQFADVTNPATWGSFEEAVKTGSPAIGFVITKDDPYTFIDLDDKLSNPASDEDKVRFGQIINAFNSYTELSTSGRGVHIIVKGKIPRGVHRSHVEIYSEGRYMICTGNAIRNIPIEERQELLDVMYVEMQPVNIVDLEQIDGDYSDIEICERASNAVNGEKYITLCNGEWQGIYPSQSEADFALLSIIAFYSKDNEQVIRLFRMSKLGKRDKAQRDSYFIGKYGMLNKIRANEPAPIDFDAVKRNAEAIMKKPEPLMPAPTSNLKPTKLTPHSSTYTTPQGLLGELTNYIFETSFKPVHEIALAGAMAFMAGIAGRAFNVSSQGLNLYIVLLAGTGRGKDGATAGINRIVSALRPTIPLITQFVGPVVFSSGPALIRSLSTKPCVFSIMGEIGYTLQEMNDARANSASKSLKRSLLDLYGKSGANDWLGTSAYSDSEKNTAEVQSPALTILGESTPEIFYNNLDEQQIADGLIPRFSIIQYEGIRVPDNPNAGQPPPKELLAKIGSLLSIALTNSVNKTVNNVTISEAAEKLFREFSSKIDKIVNENPEGYVAELWNRSHIKAKKTASLIAIGINPYAPVINAEEAAWGIRFAENDVAIVTQKFKTGDIGEGASKHLFDLEKITKEYLNSTAKQLETYNVKENLFEAKIIPKLYYTRRVNNRAAFKNDKSGGGAVAILDRTLKVMVESGMLVEIDKITLKNTFNFTGIAYAIGSFK